MFRATTRFVRRKGPRTKVEILVTFVGLLLTPPFAALLVAGPIFAVVLADRFELREVTFVNRTEVDVRVYIDGRYSAWVAAGGRESSVVWLWEGERLVEAVEDETGVMLFAVEVTKEELEALDSVIEITSER